MAKEEQICRIVGTWPFSFEAVKHASTVIQKSKGDNVCIDAVETGINKIESNSDYGIYFVGCGGIRNKNGFLELDAAIMHGRNLDYGAVTAIQGINKPISVARKVMDKSPHSILTAQGAQQFAVKHGFDLNHDLMIQKLDPNNSKPRGHDTLGLICYLNGEFVVGVSTSGMGGKEAGRVGDSAICGAGLYADNEGGAACCSGDGDLILKHCPAYRVVSYLRMGWKSEDACKKVITEIMIRSKDFIELVIIAVDKEVFYPKIILKKTRIIALCIYQYI
ncbi:hypothetical protein LOTGIDRAFT_235285 [Lottia gigantea]|uniref:Uncharacterized protein n=1 Tax=Lottia gigantea TaxID=225164 RepID=V3ZQP9_LOTGI|nr:hypothetical protein LOTGIDRAFT_235285 [Lottia gigantea]ESO86677.1 hypothetical protein LOTGIDRAFT_235285 [Lottia gigantea]